MKRFALIAFLVTVAVTSYAQDIYTPRVLLTLGLSADEAEKVVQIERETAASVRPLQADLDVKKAELARLLIDASPNMRLVERNLRATADIEVQIRLLEIQRELSIRALVGTDRWSTMFRTIRQRTSEAQAEITDSVRSRLAELQQSIGERQQSIQNALQDNETTAQLREQFRQLQEAYQALGETIREELQ